MSDTDNHIFVENARAGFPHLYRPPVINGETGKCGVQLILDPDEDADIIEELQAEIKRVGAANFERRLPADKICLRDGDDKGRDEFDGMMVLSANCKAGTKPVVVDADDPTVIIDNEADNPIYPGCRVNAKIRIWPQNNTYGKRINCALIAIQFAKDDEPLDAATVTQDEAVAGFKGSGKRSKKKASGDSW